MIRPDNLNAKAFHELILYYLRERITNHNLEIKHLVVTNIYEWYVFDAALFEKTFAQNKTLVKQFTDFEEGRLAGNPFLPSYQKRIRNLSMDLSNMEQEQRNSNLHWPG